MSYILPPSISKISIGSATETIASGTVSITITVRNAASFSGSSYTMDLLDVGSIELDFNYIESVGDIDDFTVNLPRMEFKILDSIKLASGTTRESFVDLVSSLSGDDIMVIEMTVNSGSDYYYATRDNCEFSFSSRSVKISALHPVKFGLLPIDSEWGTSYFSGKTVPFFNINATVDCVLPRDLIEGYLTQLGDAPTIEYHSALYTETYTDTFVDGQKVFMPSEFDSGGPYDTAPDDFEVATTRVKQYALGECAIIGNVLGYGFYVPRFDKTGSNEVAITSDNLGSLEMNIKFKNVRYYDFVAEHTMGLSVDTDNESINPLGDIDASIYYPYPTYQALAGWSDLNSRFERPVVDAYPAGFAENLEIAFKKVFRVSDSSSSIDAGVYISGTIFGIDTLKPYQYFSIASGVHPLVNGKDFRPAYLKYNLKDDTIEFEAYEF